MVRQLFPTTRKPVGLPEGTPDCGSDKTRGRTSPLAGREITMFVPLRQTVPLFEADSAPGTAAFDKRVGSVFSSVDDIREWGVPWGLQHEEVGGSISIKGTIT